MGTVTYMNLLCSRPLWPIKKKGIFQVALRKILLTTCLYMYKKCYMLCKIIFNLRMLGYYSLLLCYSLMASVPVEATWDFLPEMPLIFPTLLLEALCVEKIGEKIGLHVSMTWISLPEHLIFTWGKKLLAIVSHVSLRGCVSEGKNLCLISKLPVWR